MKDLNGYIDALKGFFDKISNLSILNRNPDKKTITVAFCVIIAAIAAVSGIFVISEMGSDSPEITTTELSSSDNADVSVMGDITQELTGNFLFALADDDKIGLLGVLRIDSHDKSLKVSFVDPDTYSSFNNLSGTMNEHYKNGGVNELVWAVGEYANISIERYIIADEASFTDLMEVIGEMTVMLEHEVICGQDAASFIIEKGEQILIPGMMTKYFMYLCDNQPEYNHELAKVMTLYGEKLFSIEDNDKIDHNFNSVVTLFKTDISALDYTNHKAVIKMMADKDILGSVTLVEDISTLK